MPTTLTWPLLVVAAGLGQESLAVPNRAYAKVHVQSLKTDTPGTQDLVITLDIKPGAYIYANPVGLEDLVPAQTVVQIFHDKTPVRAVIQYPAGTLMRNEVIGDFRIYEKTVIISARVQRGPEETGPLEVVVRMNGTTHTRVLGVLTVRAVVPME